MPKQTGLFGIEDRNLSGTFITFYISLLMCRERDRERKEMKQAGCQRFKMWQIIYAPLFKGKVHIHVWAIHYEQQNCYLPISNGIQMCQAQQEY